MDDPIGDSFQAFVFSNQARAQAEARMFQSALDPATPPDQTLLQEMTVERRREIFCLRTLLYLSQEAVERARQLTRRGPSA